MLALKFGRVGIAELKWAVSETTLHADLSRVEVQHSADMDSLYPPLRPTNVKIETRRGVFERYVDCPYGEPGNAMSHADLQDKFLSLTIPVLGTGQAAELAAVLDADDTPVRRLTALMTPVTA
jgi:2-methylcitrate dehydratase PrpD